MTEKSGSLDPTPHLLFPREDRVRIVGRLRLVEVRRYTDLDNQDFTRRNLTRIEFRMTRVE